MLIYREEIDGLRSIAVIPVIFYHAGLTTYFSGGYIGVDIFFVISGYLITSVIENECVEGTFSLINFYERRCRRILPILFFILFLSSLFAYYYMLPGQLKEFGETIISIICLCSNIYFWWKDDGYFSRLTELNPLVHTWSLAVEEQFYFVFPLLCFLFMKKKKYLIIVLICFAVMSFILCQWGGNLELISSGEFQMFSQHRYATFYLPIGRIWELLIGAFIAFNHSSIKKFSRVVNELFSFVGLGLIIISVVYFDNRKIPPFPNSYTLIPTCGAALIILFGDKNTLVGYVLSIRPLRWIGLISYSAYLWHQPLLAFLRLRSYETPEMIMLVVVFPLSVLSYFFIEQPFRNKKHFSRKHIFCMSGLAFIITSILGLYLIQTGNNRSLILNKGGDSYLSDLKKYGDWQYVVRDFDALASKSKTFSNQTKRFNKKLVLIGDSFAQDFYNMIIEGKHLPKYEIRVYFVYSRCQIYIGNEDRKQFIEAKHHQTCTNANDIKYALPLIRQADVIMLASNWYEWSSERLPMTLKLLNLTKQQQVFVIGVKHFGTVSPNLYVNKSAEFRIKQYQYPKIEIVKINNLLEKSIDKSIFVNTMKMICNGFNQTCPLFTPDGKLISHDGAHLTKHGAHFVGNIIFNKKPLNIL
jgi:peptidoglycan/LPS O-acetylase OafA/YrhL